LFVVIFVASRESDTPLEVEAPTANSLDLVIKAARSKVENYAFSGKPSATDPIGFVVENNQGDELHRWYSDGRDVARRLQGRLDPG
jgi:hypothetical protein